MKRPRRVLHTQLIAHPLWVLYYVLKAPADIWTHASFLENAQKTKFFGTPKFSQVWGTWQK